MKSPWLLFGMILLSCYSLFGQDPVYFKIDADDGLPSNEIYNLLEDRDGLIWLGTDGGLYKYNRAQSKLYFSPNQKSRASTGLTQTASGRIYVFNFHGQVFYVEEDSLKELQHSFGPVNNLSLEPRRGLVVSHLNSVSIYDEQTGVWLREDSSKNIQRNLLNCSRAASDGQIWFLEEGGINHWNGGKAGHVTIPNMLLNSPGLYILETMGKDVWLFSRNEGEVFRHANGKLSKWQDEHLSQQLKGRKITNVVSLKDGHLWICTYSGLIRYHPATRSTRSFFPEFSFSDVALDRQGCYWFSTLGHGVFRIPDLDFLAWPTGNEPLLHITHDEKDLFLASNKGNLFRLDPSSGRINEISSGRIADIQALHYDPVSACIRVSINENHYLYKNDQLKLHLEGLPSHKSFLRLNQNDLVACSSVGGYVYSGEISPESQKINEEWCREAVPGPDTNSFYMATNNGLFYYEKRNGIWEQQSHWLDGLQINALGRTKQGQVFALTFQGKIYEIEEGKDPELIAALPLALQPRDLLCAGRQLFLATNKGLHCLDLDSHQWKTLRRGGGLLSENIQEICVFRDRLWMATDKGLQSVPLHFELDHAGPLIFLRELRVDGQLHPIDQAIELGYRQQLRLKLEASDYRSGDAFHFLYKVSSLDTNWTKVPADPGQIDLYGLPAGEFKIQIAGMDHLGRRSESIIQVQGRSHPPFWLKWWFLVPLIALTGLAFWLILRYRIAVLKKKQFQEIRRLKLENQLVLSQETALKAQMNPHFIFNVLNSIQGYIYENDRKQAVSYLNSFSDLIRNTLEMSSKPWVSLEAELKALETYINLEGMLLDQEFSYNLEVDPQIDMDGSLIPSLIIQPFVENSFKHGLRHRKGKVWLRIEIGQVAQGVLRISIADNGIGREAAAKLNAANPHKPVAFSSKANERRINLLNRKEKDIVGLEILDNFDETGASSGTTVILKIKCNE